MTASFSFGAAPRLGARMLPLAFALSVSACSTAVPSAKLETDEAETPIAVSSQERNCLVRGMYFEAKRNHDDGLMAVGTVIMNRVKSPAYPKSICRVVGQKNQFARGVLSRKMNPKEMAKVEKAADQLLAGKRHPKLEQVLHFHVSRMRFAFANIRYIADIGGNAFYAKLTRNRETL